MSYSVHLIRQLEKVDVNLREVLLSLLEEFEKSREETVTRHEFLELKEIVADIGRSVKELSEAQKRTELRVEELAEAQKRTELRVEELAEAQKRTELEVRALVLEHRETRRQLGGLTMTVGCGLEDKAYPALPALLQRDHQLTITGRLKRGYLKDKSGQEVEVNILGQARRDGSTFTVVGEAKSQLSRRNIDAFLRKTARLALPDTSPFLVVVTYMTSASDVEDYARSKGVALYHSFDL